MTPEDFSDIAAGVLLTAGTLWGLTLVAAILWSLGPPQWLEDWLTARNLRRQLRRRQ